MHNSLVLHIFLVTVSDKRLILNMIYILNEIQLSKLLKLQLNRFCFVISPCVSFDIKI